MSLAAIWLRMVLNVVGLASFQPRCRALTKVASEDTLHKAIPSGYCLDPFLRFWHRWLQPHRALLEIGQCQAETLSEIRNNLLYVVAPVWETIAQQHLLVAAGRGQIPLAVQEVGSWWARGAQVDVVGVNRPERRVIFGEARWRSSGVTAADLNELIEKGLLWLKGDTARWDVRYAFFARGFGQVRAADIAEENVHLFTPSDVIAAGAGAAEGEKTHSRTE